MQRTTLYRAFDEQDRLLYVGITGDPFARLGQHHGAGWTKWTARLTFESFETRTEAEAAELAAIRTEDPVWNVQGRPVDRHLRWMAAYPHLDPDSIDLDAVMAEARQILDDLVGGGTSR